MKVADASGYPVVVKAQVQVGGRGKAGGIKLANNAEETRFHANNILGMDIKGHVVKRVWVEHASDIEEEYYASFTLDRAAKKHLLMLSAQGGVEIEEVAEKIPMQLSNCTLTPLTDCQLLQHTRPQLTRRFRRRHLMASRQFWCSCTVASPKVTVTSLKSTR